MDAVSKSYNVYDQPHCDLYALRKKSFFCSLHKMRLKETIEYINSDY